jgi:hypothetical protein
MQEDIARAGYRHRISYFSVANVSLCGASEKRVSAEQLEDLPQGGLQKARTNRDWGIYDS